MLTRLHYKLIADAIEGKVDRDAYAAFTKLPTRGEQVEWLKEKIKDADLFLPETAVADYVTCVTWLTDTGAKTSRVITWPKQPAPLTYPALTMRWPEEYMKVAGMAAKISHSDLIKDWDHVSTALSHAVHETLGLGGMVEFICDQRIPEADPTMQLFFQAILESLKTSHADWFDASGDLLPTLPDGVNGKSDEMLEYEAEAQLRRHKRESAAKSAAARRAKQIAEAQAKRATFFAACDGRDTLLAAVMELANQMSLMEFDKAKAEGTLITCGTDTRYGPTWVPELIVRLCNDGLQDDQAVHFLEDYVLSKVRARLPNWFKETEDGSIRFRRAPHVEKPKGLDRPTRSLRKLLAKLIEKHGEDAVRVNLDGITGR